MPEEISVESAGENLVSCAVFLADKVKSVEARAAALQPVIERFLERGDVDSAAHYADTIGDPFLRDRMLIRVISKCVEIDDEEYGRQLVDAIEEDGARSSALEAFALRLAAKGRYDDAIGIAEELGHASDAFAGIAVNLAANGEDSRVSEVLGSIDFFSARVEAMNDIARLRLENGANSKALEILEEAFEICADIEFDEDRIRGYIEIGSTFIAADRRDRAIAAFDEARKLAEQIEGVHKDNILGNISVLFLQTGSIDLADRTLDLVQDKTQIASALTGFARVYLEEGEEDEAFDALEEAYAIYQSEPEKEVRNSKARFQVLNSIAVQFSRAGKFERAMEIALENPDGSLVTNALVNIAQVSILRGEDDLFRQALGTLEGEGDRVTGLLSASDAKNSMELKDDAVALLDEAADMLDSVPQLIVRSEIQMELAKRYDFYGIEGKARDLATECLQTIPEILGEGNRAIALCDLSGVYDAAGFEVAEADKEVLETIIRKSLA